MVPHRWRLPGLPGVAALAWRFTCPSCGYAGGWQLGDGRYECAGCHRRTSVTAGMIFDRTRTPLTVWFTACWLFATAKDGISALSLQRSLEIGSYQTAWAMLGRLRSVLVRPGRDRLAGRVEVDETISAGRSRGCAAAGTGQEGPDRHRGRGQRAEGDRPVPHGAAGRRVLSLAASRRYRPRRAGRDSHHDAWMGYHGMAGLGYVHQRRSQRAARARGDDPGKLLPAVHRVASLAKRWLLSTHQGSVRKRICRATWTSSCSVQRRRSRSRGLVFYRLLELAAGHDPVRYRESRRQATAEDPDDPASGTRASAEPGTVASRSPVASR